MSSKTYHEPVRWTVIFHPAVAEWISDADRLGAAERRAVVLVAGDKAGHWQQWYRVHIPIADARFEEHLRRS